MDSKAQRKISTWRGKPIDMLTRDELITAVEDLAGKLDEAYATQARTFEAWSAARRARLAG